MPMPYRSSTEARMPPTCSQRPRRAEVVVVNVGTVKGLVLRVDRTGDTAVVSGVCVFATTDSSSSQLKAC